MIAKSIIHSTIGLAALCVGTMALATYPERPITLVIPFGAGGSHDQNAQVIANMMPLYIDQEVVVKLSPGQAGRTGTEEVAKADPDGYTLLFSQNYVDMLQQHVVDLPYAPLDDFVPIARVNYAPISVVVRADSPYQSFQDLMSAARTDPGGISLSHSGEWGATFVPALQIMKATKTEFTLKPYEGGGPALAAFKAGEVDVTLVFPSQAASLMATGEARVLATAGSERLYLDVPSFSEIGLTGDIGFMHRVVLAPSNTPADVVSTLETAFEAMQEDITYVNLMAQIGENTDLMTASAYQDIRERQNHSYQDLVESVGR